MTDLGKKKQIVLLLLSDGMSLGKSNKTTCFLFDSSDVTLGYLESLMVSTKATILEASPRMLAPALRNV